MLQNVNPEQFALAVVSSTPATSNSPEAIAKEKIEQYSAAFHEAEAYNKEVVKPLKKEAHKAFYAK